MVNQTPRITSRGIRKIFAVPFLLSLILLIPGALSSQELLRYMSYNLLNYGLPYVMCNATNNNITAKDQHLQLIFAYVQPDIFAVCEVVPNSASAQRVLDSAINRVGPRVFSRATFTNFSGGDLVNMIYYDPLKLGLLSQDVVITDVRDINLYRFYLKTSTLHEDHDTLYLTAVLAHLKAGNTSADEQRRSTMTLTLMNYLNAQNQPGNYLFSGDFNFYKSAEMGYQYLTNYSNAALRFNDPINRPGSWNENAGFSEIHTQSTRTASNVCGASGGMDDRFDFILASNSLMAGSQGMQCVPSSYHALGQDGLHFNQSVNAAPQNTQVPPQLINALYGMSDHLPVVMDIEVSKTLAISGVVSDPFRLHLVNPAEGYITFWIDHPPSSLLFSLTDMTGRIQMALQPWELQSGRNDIPLPAHLKGLYLLRFQDEKGNGITRKLFVP